MIFFSPPFVYSFPSTKGKSWAEEMIANYYYKGSGCSQSYDKAFKFFSLAAAKGEANSMSWVGFMYAGGEGVGQSFELAF